ncbi:preprotein translocase subunit TatB [Pseudoxanthomonas jiangsuensis]|uniref:recombinase family protein n=1 Tax=Pseudoxanthomonas jiangsuensis TaxID=619688 RepID=UPI001391AE17|nr:preprotein translocase subunit TatB [Pseudoxanthomonas jiangsuensis]
MRVAAYARYSSDQQREASLEDQLRNCRSWCTRHNLAPPVEYTDAAVSGARLDRAGYQRLLAEIHHYDVLLVDDLSRLGRDKDEVGKTVKRLTFSGVRLVGVCDGVDTQRRGHKIDVGLRGLMSELYLDDLADKTHRGLTGRALSGASAGGLPYGYRVTGTGQRVIDAEQADVVRRIYAEFIAGHSPRTIAARLNAEHVRTARGKTWCGTAIYGDAKRGIGILANPIYIGRQVWNRSHWIKHPDSGRRVRQERPESEWITTEKPELAIIDADTWATVQARLGCNRKANPDSYRKAGRQPRHLLSGLLRCECCGGPLVVVDRYNYGCNVAKDRGTCTSKLRVPRAAAERSILAGIKRDLLSDAAYQVFQRAVTHALRAAAPDDTAIRRRLADAQRVRDNVMQAIRAGIITPGTRAELERAEAEVATLQAELDAAKRYEPAHVLPRAREVWQRAVANLEHHARNIPAARESLRELLGERIVVRTNENGDLVAEIAASSTASAETAQINVVAGAGFEPATFGL